MELRLIRKWFTEQSTIGTFHIDGAYYFYSLEDCVREPGVKIPKKTAIGAGRYPVVIDFSKRFQRMMPHILDVPMFEGIRIHILNVSTETEGCIGLGQTRGKDFIGQSGPAFNVFFPILEEGLKQGKCWITIENRMETQNALKEA